MGVGGQGRHALTKPVKSDHNKDGRQAQSCFLPPPPLKFMDPLLNVDNMAQIQQFIVVRFINSNLPLFTSSAVIFATRDYSITSYTYHSPTKMSQNPVIHLFFNVVESSQKYNRRKSKTICVIH